MNYRVTLLKKRERKNQTKKNMSGIAGAIVAGLAMLAGNVISNESNKKQAKQAAERQKKDQMELTKFNQKIGQENWENTNFAAQREQIEKAGLNVGMMYSGSGGGGGMGMTPAGSTSKADTVPLDISGATGMGLQAAMAKANIKNIEADTKNKEIDAEQKAGVDLENKEATVTNLKNQAEQWGLAKEGMEYDNTMKKLAAETASKTQESLIKAASEAAKKLEGEAMSAQAEGHVDNNTMKERIKQIRQETIQNQLEIAATKAGIIKTGADTTAVRQSIVNMATSVNMMVQNNMREWDKMSQTDKEIAVKQMLAKNAAKQTEFNTSGAAEIKQWTSIITDVINAAK